MMAMLSKTPLDFFLNLELDQLDEWVYAVIDARETLYKQKDGDN